MRRPSALLVLVVSLLMAGPAIAEPFEDATKAYHSGDYETAYRLIKPLAEGGLPEAQLNLGLLYEKGQGVPQDYAEALIWYRKAAEQGNAKALKWYRKAAEQGNAEAQFNLGLMYDRRLGVPQDYAEAVKWYREAAEQGFAEAQNNLGIMYFTGQGFPKDYVLAHMWFTLATSRYPASEKAKRQEGRSKQRYCRFQDDTCRDRRGATVSAGVEIKGGAVTRRILRREVHPGRDYDYELRDPERRRPDRFQRDGGGSIEASLQRVRFLPPRCHALGFREFIGGQLISDQVSCVRGKLVCITGRS